MKWHERVFELGVRATKGVTADPRELYVCPLCMLGYSRSELNRKILTPEHVPPASQGGKRLLLTCKRCNNTAGHTVDAAIAHREDALRAHGIVTGRPGNTGVRATAAVADVRANVEVRSDVKGVHIRYLDSENDPARANLYRDAMSRLGSGPEDVNTIQLTARTRFKPRRAMVGDLKSGYLAGVAYFGYKFAAQAGLDMVRDQIARPDEELIKSWWLHDRPLDNKVLWLALLNEPLECLAVTLHRSVVVLPFGAEPSTFYDRFNEMRDGPGIDQIKGVPRSWPRMARFLLDLDTT